MICKRIDIKAGNGNIVALGNYIASAGHEGEKKLFAWHEGCLATEYTAAITEIAATQEMNTRTTKNKTYHLVVSFRPEDESKLTLDMFKDIESNIAKALGFSEHQRLCGVHKNTNNLHIHIAYNMIHPEKFARHEPYRDFGKLAAVCRAMEEKYGLSPDRGKEQEREGIDQRAAAMEAHSGEQSFQSYVFERKEKIIQELSEAKSWQDVHTAFARYGIEIKLKGNGLALVNQQGKKEGMKASQFDRAFSKQKLQARFGEYQPATALAPGLSIEFYTRKSLHPKSPERDRLYKQYREALKGRDSKIDAARLAASNRTQEIRLRFATAAQELDKRYLPKKTKQKLRRLLQIDEQSELAKQSLATTQVFENIRKQYPFHNWTGYLKHQADQGNETALRVLRSKKERNEQQPHESKSAFYQARDETRLARLAKEKQLQLSGASRRKINMVIPVLRMHQLAEMEKRSSCDAAKFRGYKYRIDNHGVVLFTLADGSTIRDAGQKIYFSPQAEVAARLYGQARFGKKITQRGNAIEREQSRGRGRRDRSGRYKSLLADLGEKHRNGLRKLSGLDVVRFGGRGKVLLQDHARGDMER